MSKLVDLCIAAHEKAIEHGTLTPAERLEWMHLPMRYVGDYPVFDESRMREDWIEETTAALERITGRTRAKGVREQVVQFMQAYGDTGQRVADVCEATGADKKIVLRYLRELVDVGKVEIKLEPTRGNGSPRKRYFWTGENAGAPPSMDLLDELGRQFLRNEDMLGLTGTGVMHHHTSNAALQGCNRGCCRGLLEELFVQEQVSAARKAGGSGFAEGLALVTRRRVAAQREFESALARSGWAG